VYILALILVYILAEPSNFVYFKSRPHILLKYFQGAISE